MLDFTNIDRWINQVATELALSLPGTDSTQFPLRDLFSSLAEAAAPVAELRQIHLAAAFSQEFVEGVMFSLQPFGAEHLETLNALAIQLHSLRLDPELTFAAPAVFVAAAPAVEPALASAPAVPAASAAPEESVVVNIANDGDLLREFAGEGREHLEAIEQGVLVLEDHPTDADTLASIFRAFHTFKGGSGFLHLGAVNRLSHELESLLDLARQGRLAITSAVINLILEGADLLKVFLSALEPQLDGRAPVQPILVGGSALIRRVQEVIAHPEREVLAEEPDIVATTPASRGEAPPAAVAASSIKVNTQKFDSLMDLVGELVIAQSLVAQDPDLNASESPRLTRNLAQLGRITNELQKTAMTLRMMPIRTTFQKMNRLVRDLTSRTSKSVDFRLSGEETEMDRTIVESLGDPLMHMIRNSVDHGIESPAARLAAGKSAQGTVFLSACHQGGNIVIEIRDDGAGLNRERILAKAVTNGLVAKGAALTDQEIFHLIFAPGFSTAEKVTDLSGRGVGMDVVKRNVAQLRGKIEIDSKTGQGTTFKIFLPLTLAIIDGLVVRVGDQRYILPTLSVRESFRPTAEMLSTVYERGEMLKVRGKLLPLLRLHEFFGVTPRTTDPTAALVVVVESGREQRCVLVDDLVGKQEVVIKSLGDRFKSNQALAGAAILGDGQVGLILEPRTLVQLGRGLEASSS